MYGHLPHGGVVQQRDLQVAALAHHLGIGVGARAARQHLSTFLVFGVHHHDALRTKSTINVSMPKNILTNYMYNTEYERKADASEIIRLI